MHDFCDSYPKDRTHLGVSLLGARQLLLAATLTIVAGCAAKGPTEPNIPGVHPRHLSLSGPSNFRDLGGYRTVDGRTVKWGMLYRADNLDKLTRSDMELVDALGIGTAFDFRAPGERQDGEFSWEPERCYAVAPLDIVFEPMDPGSIRSRILAGELDAADARQILLEANRAYVTRFRSRYAQLITKLSDRRTLPAVFHCSMGKDRTGVAAALVLSALGVPKETVIEDYLLTNRYAKKPGGWFAPLVRLGSLGRQDPDDLEPLFEARREYIEAAFSMIEQQYGTFDRYLTDGLGLEQATLVRLRDNLLDGAPVFVSAATVPGGDGIEPSTGVQRGEHP